MNKPYSDDYNSEPDESFEHPLKLAWTLAILWVQMRFGLDFKAPLREMYRSDAKLKDPHIFFYHLASSNETTPLDNGDRIVKPFKVYPDDNAIIFDLITEPRNA